ncbi:probable esterase PIR7A [Aegilops tauschii subsp. strangulata]|uniref:AB hydrolase-1 domain-containing protein n=3 Tax=Aegilops tauschii TaxID=37682 RepID=A0A453GGW1_AEGTS|nr:probable esterase PIR7A [Aegilops tauschii subsp. strangulata]
MEGSSSGKHFMLVHGLGHGAWCWYKLVPMLRAAGHRVTALDMAASGAHPARMDEVPSFEDYSRPLLDAVAAAPAGERLVLVGHSLGGLNIALAMERFPRKVAAAVFLAACMPCVGRHMGVTTEEIMRRIKPDFFMDMKRMVLNTSQGPRPALVFGPKLLAAKLYDRSSAEDQTLATMLVRPGCQFLDDPTMKDEAMLTDANYGSVNKVYVVAMADASNSEEMQRWMVDLSPGTEAEEIAGADHMAMCSKPRELCGVLLRIADKYE